MKKILLLLFLFLNSIILLGASQFRKNIAKAEALINEERIGSAISKLQGMYNSKKYSMEEKAEIATILPTALRLDKQYDKALKVLTRIEGKKPVNYFLQLGEIYFDTDKFDNALKASQSYDKKSGKGNLLFAHALWLRARTYFELKNYLKCMQTCKAIIKYKPFADTPVSAIAAKDNASKLQILAELEKNTKELYLKARELYDTLMYGTDFAWYRKAREAEIDEQYDKAIKCYSMIQKGTLKDAADCYTAHCLEKNGQFKDALKAYLRFADNKPFRLYAGEALWHASMLTFREFSKKKTPVKALKLVRKLKKWLVDVHATDSIQQMLKNINNNLQSDIIDKMSPELLTKNASGNLIKTKQYPENIINRLTSPWYMKELIVKTYMLSGFLLGEADEKDAAAQEYTIAEKLGKRKVIADNGTYPALLSGLQKGIYILPIACKNKITSNNYNKIMLASFFYSSGNNDLTEELLDRFISGQYKHKRNDTASILLLKSYCLINAKKFRKAEKILKKLITSRILSKSPTITRAKYLLACLYAKSNIKKALPLFYSVAKKKDNELAPNAMIAMAVATVNAGRKSTAIKICDEIRHQFSKTPFSNTAHTLRKSLKNSEEGEFAAIVDTGKGKVINHRRTLVIPGATSWDISTSSLLPGDIILYNLKCVGNGPCKIVKGVNINLTAHEPSPPVAKGDRLIFVRAPLLYVNNLSLNFKEIFPSLNQEPTIPFEFQ